MKRTTQLTVLGVLAIAGTFGTTAALAAIAPVDLVAKRETTGAVPAPIDAAAEIVVQPLGAATAPLTATVAASPAISVKPMPQRWEITREDTTLAMGLTRWAKAAGYDFVWGAAKELPAYPLQVYGTFQEAFHRIMLDTQSTSYPLRTCIYLNNVARVIQAAQNCKR